MTVWDATTQQCTRPFILVAQGGTVLIDQYRCAAIYDDLDIAAIHIFVEHQLHLSSA